MEKQEQRIFAQLYNYFQNWLEDQTVGWDQRTFDFKQMYKLLKLQQQSLAILLTNKAPLTIEEKVKQASFYVVGGSTYKINFHIAEERWFDVSNVEEDDDTFIVRYDSIPADAYFLGTIRL